MKQEIPLFSRTRAIWILWLSVLAGLSPLAILAQEAPSCLDGFCIGQSIQEGRFDKVAWVVPSKDLQPNPCTGIGCSPENAFRGYPTGEQTRLADAVAWKYGLNAYNVITSQNLATLRLYKYECNTSARGLSGDRRFLGAYRSIPSQYLTIVGLRLINGNLTVYRIARQYPYHNQAELRDLAKKLGDEYGNRLLLYGYLSSNAYSDVIQQHKDGWFGRSTMFDPSDLTNLAAELVLIDPKTRSLLEPTSMPDSGEISALPVKLPEACNRSLPIQ